MDHRPALVQAFDPDAGLADRIVLLFFVGLANRQRVAGPGLQGQMFLIGFDEMEEADGAAGQKFRIIQRGLDQIVQRAGRRDLGEAHADLQEHFRALPADEVTDEGEKPVASGDGLQLI